MLSCLYSLPWQDENLLSLCLLYHSLILLSRPCALQDKLSCPSVLPESDNHCAMIVYIQHDNDILQGYTWNQIIIIKAYQDSLISNTNSKIACKGKHLFLVLNASTTHTECNECQTYLKVSSRVTCWSGGIMVKLVYDR